MENGEIQFSNTIDEFQYTYAKVTDLFRKVKI